MTINFNHRLLVQTLVVAVIVVVLLDLSSSYLVFCGIRDLVGLSTTKLRLVFNLDTEANVPTWFSSIILFLAAILLRMCTAVCRTTQPRDAPYWSSLACVFVYVSMDEVVGLHEKLGDWLQAHFHLAGIFYYSWVLPFSVLLFICALLYSRFLFRLPRPVRQYLIASAIIYITGALGMELLGGLYREDRWAGVIVTTIEETLEMVGVVLFIRGLLRYIQEQSDYIQIVMRNPT